MKCLNDGCGYEYAWSLSRTTWVCENCGHQLDRITCEKIEAMAAVAAKLPKKARPTMSDSHQLRHDLCYFGGMMWRGPIKAGKLSDTLRHGTKDEIYAARYAIAETLENFIYLIDMPSRERARIVAGIKKCEAGNEL